MFPSLRLYRSLRSCLAPVSALRNRSVTRADSNGDRPVCATRTESRRARPPVSPSDRCVSFRLCLEALAGVVGGDVFCCRSSTFWSVLRRTLPTLNCMLCVEALEKQGWCRVLLTKFVLHATIRFRSASVTAHFFLRVLPEPVLPTLAFLGPGGAFSSRVFPCTNFPRVLSVLRLPPWMFFCGCCCISRSSSLSGPRTTTVPRRWRPSGVPSSSSPAARRSSSPTSGVSPSTPGRYVCMYCSIRCVSVASLLDCFLKFYIRPKKCSRSRDYLKGDVLAVVRYTSCTSMRSVGSILNVFL